VKITRCDAQLLHIPLARPRASLAELSSGRLNHIVTLLVQLETDTGLNGIGVAYALQSSGRALHATLVDDLAPLVVEENPLDHERLANKVYWRLQTVGRRGLVQQAYSAIDLALWDLKGKAAGLPVHKLLGGARESCPTYGSDTGWLWMSPEQIAEASQPYLEQGLMGIKVKVGQKPEEDADRLTRLRDLVGEDIWLGVDANERYDYATALIFGRFLEEEIGADWFEEPLSCEDAIGHARLADKLDVCIAAGEMLFGLDEFQNYLSRDALDVVQPDVTRLGGMTGWLKVAALAEQHGKPVSPHLLPEIGVHQACGLACVTSVEYMPWLFPLWLSPPALVNGRLVPPTGVGWGLQINPDAVARFRVQDARL